MHQDLYIHSQKIIITINSNIKITCSCNKFILKPCIVFMIASFSLSNSCLSVAVKVGVMCLLNISYEESLWLDIEHYCQSCLSQGMLNKGHYISHEAHILFGTKLLMEKIVDKLKIKRINLISKELKPDIIWIFIIQYYLRQWPISSTSGLLKSPSHGSLRPGPEQGINLDFWPLPETQWHWVCERDG